MTPWNLLLLFLISWELPEVGEALVRDEAVRQGHEPEVQDGLELGRPAAAAGRAPAHPFLQTFQGAWSRALRSFRWT